MIWGTEIFEIDPCSWLLAAFPIVLFAFPIVLFAFSMFLLAFPMVLKAPGGSLKTFAG